ncbi:MAG: hypothetical protein ACYCZX_19755 [Rhodospirillaceae bacterium]
MRRISALAPLLLAVGMSAHARAAESETSSDLLGGFQLDLKGYVEGRAVAADDTKSWERNGLGKTRYGGQALDSNGLLLTGEGALVIEPKFGYDLTGHVVLTAAPEQYQALSLVEAFLQYKPAPTGDFGVRAKGGFFFPPISLENTSLAWTSPYTLTSSAINSWVGEELRTVGGEFTGFYHNEDLELALTGAIYTANDPAGTQLTWRGWSFNDREIGLFDRMQLTQIPLIAPTGGFAKQAPTEKPFHEIDGRVGYYAGASLDHADWGKATLLRYDNNANDRAFQLGQWAWHTDFWAAGYTANLPGDVDFVAQYMTGRTTVVTLPFLPDPIDYADFWSAYGLVSKAWGRHRVSFRIDRFVTASDHTVQDDTNEHGTALTLAYNFRPAAYQRVTLELLHVDSTRPERAAIGLPVRARETQFIASFRLFFLASLP